MPQIIICSDSHPFVIASLLKQIFTSTKKVIMKKSIVNIITATILSAVIFSSCSLTSGLTIEPNKSFELGNGRHGSYTVTATNKKKMPIDVYQINEQNVQTLVATLQPGDTETLRVAANNTLILKNNSNDTALVNVKINGDTQLSMGYKENK